jgi:spore maturation protein A
MLNIIWLLLVVSSVIVGLWQGTLDQVALSVTSSAKLAIEIALNLMGIMIFWLGIMQLAEEAGLIRVLSRVLRPILTWLFPDVPADHPAMGHMVMNIAANMLGLNNAATPFGLKAMKSLNEFNTVPHRATDAMCMFLAINTSSVQLIPASAIAFLAAAGATNPTDIVVTGILATSCSTVAAIVAAKCLAPLFK